MIGIPVGKAYIMHNTRIHRTGFTGFTFRSALAARQCLAFLLPVLALTVGLLLSHIAPVMAGSDADSAAASESVTPGSGTGSVADSTAASESVTPGSAADPAADSESVAPGSTSDSASTSAEVRAVWIAYYNFSESKNYNEEEFTLYIEEMFDNVVAMHMNTVCVHVRPFSDAMYQSSYYPWSYYASGKQGQNPGYDPLSIMTAAAHDRGLSFYAWLNPYRVTLTSNGGTDVTKLAKTNPARKWLTNKKTTDDRNVLAYGGQLYYNPSKSAVRKLIVNGIKEIVENYDVDGIIFDDYFYPSLGSKYETLFDAQEYEEYASARTAAGKKAISIDKWRRSNVNKLISSVYAAIKSIDESVAFGIAPGGYIDYFDDVDRWYVDYRTWMTKPGYVDFISPQLYWSFNSLNIYPFYETLLKWAAVDRLDSVEIWPSLPAYKMNSNAVISTLNKTTDTEWYNQHLLADMVRYSRASGETGGFIFYDYSDMVDAKNQTAVELLIEEFER